MIPSASSRCRTVASLASLLALLLAPSASAVSPYSITIDTSRLTGSAAEIVVVLTGTNGSKVILKKFAYGGGNAISADPEVRNGNAAGSVSTEVVLSNSPRSFTNVFGERFVAGRTLAFDMLLETAVDAVRPDQVAVYLFGTPTDASDPFGNAVVTNDPVGFNSLLTIDITSATPELQPFQCAGGGACLVATPRSGGEVIYWSDGNTGQVMKSDLTAHTTVGIDHQISGPYSLIFDRNGNIIYTAGVGRAGSLRMFDPLTGTDTLVVDFAHLQVQQPIDLTLDPSGNSVVISMFSPASVVRVDLTTRTLTLLTQQPRGTSYEGITYDDVARLFVLECSVGSHGNGGGIVRIDPATGNVLAHSPTFVCPWGLTYDPVTSLLWTYGGPVPTCLQAFSPETLQMQGQCVAITSIAPNGVPEDIKSDGEGNLRFTNRSTGKIGSYNIDTGTSTDLFDARPGDPLRMAPFVGLGSLQPPPPPDQTPEDSSAPAIVCGSPDGSWHAQNVTITCTAEDRGSGLAHAQDASFTLQTAVPVGMEDANAATDSREVCDKQGNCATAGPIRGNKVDKKAPTVNCGSADRAWHSAEVSVACTGVDAGSGLADASAASFSLATSVGSGVEVSNASTDTRNVCDRVGNCTRAGPVAGIMIDTKAPILTCASADGLWHGADVTITCFASDEGSGVAAADKTFGLTTAVAAGVETANASTNTRTVCDAVKNCSTAGPITAIKIDKKPPSIAIAAPAGNYLVLQANVTASYSCDDGGSGITSCSAPTVSGGALDFRDAGSFGFTVTATDAAGNTATVTSPYAVGYSICDVQLPGSVNSGRTIPIKVKACSAIGNASRPDLVLTATGVSQVPMNVNVPLQDAGNANPDMKFRYTGGAVGYIFNLQTTGYPSGKFVLKFNAGTDPLIHTVSFQVR
jgi:hypothetical protein